MVVVSVAALLVAGATIACANGRIPINSFVGTRIRSVMMSESICRAGHRAARPAELIGAVATGGIALTGFLPTFATAVPSFWTVATIVLIGSTLLAAPIAHPAAVAVLGAEQSTEELRALGVARTQSSRRAGSSMTLATSARKRLATSPSTMR